MHSFAINMQYLFFFLHLDCAVTMIMCILLIMWVVCMRARVCVCMRACTRMVGYRVSMVCAHARVCVCACIPLLNLQILL